MRRSIPALIVLAVAAGAVLTGCSASDQASGCTVHSGSGSDSIIASGKFGADPKAKVPGPLNVTRTQATTLITGKGDFVQAGGAADLSITLYDPSTGASAQTQAGFFPVAAGSISKGLTHALECSRVGSRLAVVISPKDGSSVFGSADGQSAVVVVDVESATPDRANGHVRPATPGFPTVVLDTNGRPGIVIGSQSAPTKVRTAVLKQGDGRKAKKSDTLVVQTQTVSWSDKTTASGSWEQGAPSAQSLSDDSALSKALIGTRVGTQLEVLLPKSKSGGDASVTVVDVLGVLPKS